MLLGFSAARFGDTNNIQRVCNPERNKVDPSPLASFRVNCSAVVVDQSLLFLVHNESDKQGKELRSYMPE